MGETAVAERKPKKNISEGKMELRAEPVLIARVDEAAARRGLTRSSYIRMILLEQLEREERTRRGPAAE